MYGSREKKIFTNGCFDIIHRGHLELLRYCKSLGYVIVGVNTDKSVRELKGTDRPFFSQQDRRFMLESIKYVDEIHFFDEATPHELIKQMKPDIIVKGGDYKPEDVVGSDLCEVKIFNFVDGYSTTNVLSGIRNDG